MTLTPVLALIEQTLSELAVTWLPSEAAATKHTVMPRAWPSKFDEDLSRDGGVVASEIDENASTVRRRRHVRSLGFVVTIQADNLAELEDLFERLVNGLSNGTYDAHDNWIGVDPVGATWSMPGSLAARVYAVHLEIAVTGGVYMDISNALVGAIDVRAQGGEDVA